MSSYDVTPANQSCSLQNKGIVTPNAGTPNSSLNQSTETTNAQLETSGQYDNVDNLQIKPLKGGMNKAYTIKFRNKEYYIDNAIDEEDAIIKIIKNKIYKKDYLVEINEEGTKDNSVYIIRGNFKHKFKKIY
jgi:hypothetical protein